ncbi:MAG TPA: SAM-dependent chlorinase/fluorinase [Polyangiales bacterium]|nr:SAM-dependent chlorinase/fluorinase [Polyangiales bacterium]
MSLITLTTDFGTRDPYVAQLKAALYRRGPSGLQVVDLSHDLPAQNVLEAARFVADALPQFPAGTIHLVIVDPGVGSARRPLAIRAGEQLCVGPDNGVLSLLYDAELEAVTIEPERLGITQLSATFHGRDLFAPAAAFLASGSTLESLGKPLDPRTADLVRVVFPEPARDAAGFVGEVIHIDRFGNLITSLRSAELHTLARDDAADAFALTLRGKSSRIVGHYAEVPEGCLLGVLGSSDRLEIAVRNGNAAEHTGARIGDRVRLEAV